jgi:hypothetical protein
MMIVWGPTWLAGDQAPGIWIPLVELLYNASAWSLVADDE